MFKRIVMEYRASESRARGVYHVVREGVLLVLSRLFERILLE